MMDRAYNKLQQAIFSGDKSSFDRWLGFLNCNYDQGLEFYPWVEKALKVRDEILQETVELQTLAIEANSKARLLEIEAEHQAVVKQIEADEVAKAVQTLADKYQPKSSIVKFDR